MLFADVPQETIDLHGAVSPEVARALAEGIRARPGLHSASRSQVSPGRVTHPRGPDAEKPIGLVYIGLADGRETPGQRTQSQRQSGLYPLVVIPACPPVYTADPAVTFLNTFVTLTHRAQIDRLNIVPS